MQEKLEEERPAPLPTGAVKGMFWGLWPQLFYLLGAVIEIRAEWQQMRENIAERNLLR